MATEPARPELCSATGEATTVRGPRTAKQTNKQTKQQTTIQYHLTPVRMAIIKKSTTVNAREGVEKREPSCSVGGNVN